MRYSEEDRKGIARALGRLVSNLHLESEMTDLAIEIKDFVNQHDFKRVYWDEVGQVIERDFFDGSHKVNMPIYEATMTDLMLGRSVLDVTKPEGQVERLPVVEIKDPRGLVYMDMF